MNEQDIVDALSKNDDIAVMVIGGVQYYSGQLFDMEKLTKVAHENGAFALFDLAHAVGNVPLKMLDWQVDGACWCTYKYLNSGTNF